MRALRAAANRGIEFSGVGGAAMEAEGLRSLFPLSDIAVMGILPVLARLPTLLARIRQTADAIIATPPDALVIIDSPDFTHRVARRVRAALPSLPIIDYVSPSVWAWRPGRAKAMRAYVDCVLALLPFEPSAHARLGGPRCVYVGHPLIERLGELRPNADEARRRESAPPLVLALPGSRRSIMSRVMEDLGAAIGIAARSIGPLEVILPTTPQLADEVGARARNWPVKPRIVVGEAEKYAAFRRARAALAASGTVTLELALAGVPLVGAYKVSRLEEQLKYFIEVPSILLPNLILEAKAIPEFLQWDCTPEKLAEALRTLIPDGPARHAQLKALARLDGLMTLAPDDTPSARAAREALAEIRSRVGGAGASRTPESKPGSRQPWGGR
jgi:lipid-A-disaccharide synthase